MAEDSKINALEKRIKELENKIEELDAKNADKEGNEGLRKENIGSENISRREFLKKAGMGSLGLGALISPVSAQYFIRDDSFSVETSNTGDASGLAEGLFVDQNQNVNIPNGPLNMNNNSIMEVDDIEVDTINGDDASELGDSTDPAGNDGELQFNNDGELGSSLNFSYRGKPGDLILIHERDMTRPEGIAVRNDVAYIVDNNDHNMSIFDISDPENPTKITSVNPSGDNYREIVLEGNRVYIRYQDGVTIMNIRDPANPVEKGVVSAVGRIRGIGIGNSYLVCGDSSMDGTNGGYYIFDVSDPENPSKLDEIVFDDTDFAARGSFITDGYAYVGSDYGLKIVDISDPNNITELGTAESGNGNIFVSGTYAYTSSGSVVDVSDLNNPTVVGSFTSSHDIHVAGDYIFTADVAVIDISDPTNPQKIADADSSRHHGIALNRGYIYQAASFDGFKVYSHEIVNAQYARLGRSEIGHLRANRAKLNRVDLIGSLYAGSDVHVEGELTKSSGSFIIDHPHPGKKEQGFKLKHSFVESPTAGDNIYRYKVEIEGGNAELELPDYFKYLNKDPQVWITPVDVRCSSYRAEVEDLNTVIVEAEKDGEYNVLVIGTRKDDAAEEHWQKGCEYRI